MKAVTTCICCSMVLSATALISSAAEPTVVFDDDFGQLPSRLISSPVGAHTEYHYLPEAAPVGNWAVSTFASRGESQRAWRVQGDRGEKIVAQTYTKKGEPYWHPMLVAGDPLWQDYTVTVRFAPQSENGRCGIAFRYQNDRCYYFFGLEGKKLRLLKVRHASALHRPNETVLAETPFAWKPLEYLTATVSVSGSNIRAGVENGPALEATDATYQRGRIALLADGPGYFSSVRVAMPEGAHAAFTANVAARKAELSQLQQANPKPVVWKKISTMGFGVGRNLRFGDLNGDGQIDVLIGQVVHHGPSDQYSELSCLTAMTFDAKQLWRTGQPDKWKDHLTNDVGFQIHDLDRDGRNEVIYCRDFEIIVADGATGKIEYKAPTPKTRRDDDRYERILGDCLYFCDLQGKGHPSDIIIKDRYWHVWALNDRLELLWTAECTTGHYPFAYDTDGDGKDELAVGYTLFDDDGTKLWSLDGKISDHCDGVAIAQFHEGRPPHILNAASDEGIFFTDLSGNILLHHYFGHVQNPAIANFRDDLPGLETVSINFWRNQGILNFFDADHQPYHDCEPVQCGSMCLPINWTGRSEEFFVHSPNVDEGGMFDGWGRCVVRFPDDGHPDMCNAVLDIAGDCRDEVVVWDPAEIWVYTQDDNPKPGRLYRPQRNPLYNYSNYQASVSLPGWSE